MPATLRPASRRACSLRDGDERRFGIALPQRNFRGTRRMVQGLNDRRRRQSRERERHRIVAGLVVDDVELARAFHSGGQVQHFVHLPGPHRFVVPVTERVGGVQRRRRLRVAGGKQRHLVAAGDQPFGQAARSSSAPIPTSVAARWWRPVRRGRFSAAAYVEQRGSALWPHRNDRGRFPGRGGPATGSRC